MPGTRLNACLALTLLPPTIITTPVAGVVTPPVIDLAAMESLTAQSTFAWGSSGIKITIWIQTSFDGGISWVDVICQTFGAASARKISSVKAATAVAASYGPLDKGLADDSVKDGVLGSMLRVAYSTQGAFGSNSILSIYAVVKG